MVQRCYPLFCLTIISPNGIPMMSAAPLLACHLLHVRYIPSNSTKTSTKTSRKIHVIPFPRILFQACRKPKPHFPRIGWDLLGVMPRKSLGSNTFQWSDWFQQSVWGLVARARSWYLFGGLSLLYLPDSQMNVWRVHSTKLAILSLQWRMQCLSSSSLGALNFLSICLGMNVAECSRVAGPQVQAEHQMTTLLVLSTWEKMALQNNRLETCKTWSTGASVVGSRPVLRGLVPSSCAEVAGIWFAISLPVMWPFGLVNGGFCATLFFWLACSLDDRHGNCVWSNLLDIAGTALLALTCACRSGRLDGLSLEVAPGSLFPLLFLSCHFFGRKCPNSCCFLIGCTGLQKYSRMLMLVQWLHGSWQAGELHLSSLRCIYCRYHRSGCITVCKSISWADDRQSHDSLPVRLWRKSEPVEVGRTSLQRGIIITIIIITIITSKKMTLILMPRKQDIYGIIWPFKTLGPYSRKVPTVRFDKWIVIPPVIWS